MQNSIQFNKPIHSTVDQTDSTRLDSGLIFMCESNKQHVSIFVCTSVQQLLNALAIVHLIQLNRFCLCAADSQVNLQREKTFWFVHDFTVILNND